MVRSRNRWPASSECAEKREAAGLTQTELAAKMGEYQSFVARLESGQRRVDVVELLEIAAILRFNPNEALDRLSALER
ncbi:transcriptional regulator [Sinorhizobium sp. A49]|uniref:helix-turn-helix domain-containing protein n=1 Tax=Sinorhizobium sp. A49 TaxID=1945861 RepID=UPI00098560FA|nr:helix-turn-helix transcriptional regulator [Sinorhizobium sp. A49]OOG61736.1 transcriptional regulator [Sinorhizobium sp. A49]